MHLKVVAPNRGRRGPLQQDASTVTDRPDQPLRIPPRDALKAAADLVERAAYELADQQPSGLISDLIVISSDIQQILQRLPREDRPTGPIKPVN